MELTTARLRLREFVPSDLGWLQPITESTEVTRYTDWGPNKIEDTEAFLREAATYGRGPDAFAWAVVLQDGTGIGSASLATTSTANRRATFGYMLDAARWGNGYATEVAQAVLQFARTGLGAHRVEATCHPENAASVRVLQKAGLQLEGHLHDHMLVRGSWRDSLLFAVVTPE